jgi:hypothetical protein
MWIIYYSGKYENTGVSVIEMMWLAVAWVWEFYYILMPSKIFKEIAPYILFIVLGLCFSTSFLWGRLFLKELFFLRQSATTFGQKKLCARGII